MATGLLAVLGLLQATTAWGQQRAASAPNSGATRMQPAGPGLNTLVRRQLPDVRGMELRVALASLRGAGFTAQPEPVQPLDGRRVTGTQPDPGGRYLLSEMPTVVVRHAAAAQDGPAASGPLRMPALLGMTCDEAATALRPVKQRLSACEPGTILGRQDVGRINRQQPAADALLQSGVAVRVWTEPDRVRVPNVTQQLARQAVQRLADARLRADTDGATAAGQVVRAQMPVGNTWAAPGSSVRLVLESRLRVPELRGMTCEQAQARLASVGLNQFDCLEETVAGTAPGRIHRQMPAANTELSEPRRVQAWFAVARLEVPRLLGLDEAAARQALAARGLRGDFGGPQAAQGRRVATQSPEPGTRIAPDRPVRATLELVVPALNGLQCEAARQRASAHGFDQLRCEWQSAGPQEPIRRVFKQLPEAGKGQGAAVPLVATLAQPVTVPDVRGLSLPDARERLAAVGLLAQPDQSDGDRDVRAQKPAAQAEVAPGGTVALATRRMDRVPALKDLSLAQARTRVRQAGMLLRADHDDRPDARRVTAQTPAPGLRVASGQAVLVQTVVEVLVPDLGTTRLSAASSLLTAQGLDAAPDVAQDPEHRKVVGQTPAAGSRVPEHTKVQLTTRRQVIVPSLIDQGCDAAKSQLTQTGLQLKGGACELKTRWPIVLGEPHVVQQDLDAGAEVDEQSTVGLVAEPAPWSAPAQVVTALLAGALMLARPWAGARLSVRVVPDAAPRVRLVRWSDEDDDAPPVESHASGLTWRMVESPPLALVRGAELVAQRRIR